MPSRTLLLDERALGRTLARMATEIVERGRGTDDLVLVGIQRRGVELADRLKRLIDQAEESNVPSGKLDITLYRDDLQAVGARPVVGETRLPNLDGRTVVIVDDVLYTGRTVRAALDECADFGRPRRILLCVLIDRGGRELPIQADIVGTAVSAAAGDRVDGFVSELDGRDAVEPGRESKGETLVDTARNLEAMRIDMVVIRHGASGAAQFLGQRIRSNVINAGDGKHEHPTQGLLDMLTLRDRFKRLAGLKVAICGDILHSRVARSNIWGLLKLGAEVGVCGPATLLPRNVHELGVTILPRIEDAIQWADALNVLRLQLERMQAGFLPS